MANIKKKRVALQVALALTATTASTAYADCAGLINALERARAHPRVAQLLVDETGHPQGVDPITLRIDDTIYEDFDGIEYRTRRVDPADTLAAKLRGRPQEAKCKRLGDETFAGVEVVLFRFIHADIDPGNNPVTLLVARDSGLPIHHSYAGFGARGFVWVYGDAVREPAWLLTRN